MFFPPSARTCLSKCSVLSRSHLCFIKLHMNHTDNIYLYVPVYSLSLLQFQCRRYRQHPLSSIWLYFRAAQYITKLLLSQYQITQYLPTSRKISKNQWAPSDWDWHIFCWHSLKEKHMVLKKKNMACTVLKLFDEILQYYC